MRPLARLLALLLLAVVLPLAPATGDQRSTARRFREALADEPSLIAFLRAMPKGGDLHNHAGGSVFVEHGLREAVRQGLFYNPRLFRFEAEQSAENVPASRLLTDDPLRYAYFNRATMRGPFGGAAGGHDHFFSAFGPLGSGWQKTDDAVALAEIVRRARMQNLQYLELMHSPETSVIPRLRAAAAEPGTDAQVLQRIRPLLPDYVREARAELDRLDREVARLAEVPAPLSGPGGPVTVRYLITAYRTGPDATIFAAWAAAFALMQEDRRVVGVNFAAPEDHPIARERFDRHMAILDFLWKQFDRPNVTLHAGELNVTLAPLEDLTSHIRKSIEIGHARRIGHGTAVAWEDNAAQLLRKMRDERIAVEVCPTSAAVILGKSGSDYPFHFYRKAGVPLTLNTDDDAVSRSNITLEYLRAARSWDLSYADLKELARNSLEYSFLPGESLWTDGAYRKLREPFRGLDRRGWQPTPAQEQALAASDRAAVQLRLERALAEFEQDE
ncbi:MAG: adenosine deaminase [Armatimonadota bacterium]